MKNVVVTGATGTIGLALVDELVSRGCFVTCICRKNSARIARLPHKEKLQIVECELERIQTVAEALPHNFDTFFHLAWENTRHYDNTLSHARNIKHTLEAAALAVRVGCNAFIGAGSQAEYGRVEGRVAPATPPHPDTAYGIAKLTAGHLSRLFCNQHGMRHVWPRIFSVYGPGDAESTLIMTLIARLLHGERPKLTACEQLWDYLYVADCANALALLGEKGLNNKIYCIGSGVTKKLREFVMTVRDIISPSLPLGFGEVAYSSKQIMSLSADISALQNDTDFTPAISFEDGIRETISWFKDNIVLTA